MKKNYVLIIALLITAVSFGQITYLSDDFNYSDGNLAGNNGWTAFSAPGVNPLQVVSNEVVIIHGSGSREDVRKDFTALTTGVVYASFDIKVSDGAPISGADSEYFANFDTGTTARARVDVVPASGGGDFSIGIASKANGAEATWATDLTFNTVYKITIKYDIGVGKATLWVDASSEGDTSISGTVVGTSTIDSFSFRQSDSTSDETIRVDNLIISDNFGTTLSTQKINQIEGFAVYPNPITNGEFAIRSTSASVRDVQIYDMLGKQVYAKQIQANERVQVANLTKGIYILKVEEEGKVATRKLIIE